MRFLVYMAAVFGVVFTMISPIGAANAQTQVDPGGRGAGYYFPKVTSSEVFDRKIADVPPASRAVRVAFVTDVTRAQFKAPANPRYAIFAKGDQAQRLVIVALDDQVFKTLYRARAVLAQLTANARSTAFFHKAGLNSTATFLDLLSMLDFKSLTLSDGATWSHRIEIH